MSKVKEIKCKFDTGAEVTVIGLKALIDNEQELISLSDKIQRNGKQVDDINSYSGRLRDVYELPVTSLQVGDDIFNHISVCISLGSEKSVIGMDIIGLYDFTYNPEEHCISYTRVRKWERNPNIKYTLARKIEELNIIEENGMKSSDDVLKKL